MVENRNEIKTVIQIAWPSVMESFFVALASLIDTLMVSTVGAYAVAAVGITVQPKFLGMAVFIALNVAVSSIVARRKGEKNRKGANESFLGVLCLTVILSILLSIFFVVFSEPLMKFCGSEPETHKEATTYFRIIMGCQIFNMVSLVINAAQRGVGNTKIALWTNFISTLVNLSLNYLLIGGKFGFPSLGIKGAAIATVMGTMMACFMSICSILKEESFISISYMLKNGVGWKGTPIGTIQRIAGSVLVEQVLMRIGFMATAIMAADMGTNAMAAHQMGIHILTITFAFGDGMQAAAVALIGESLGRKQKDRAIRYGKICQKIGLIISCVVFVVIFFGGKCFYQCIFREEEIIRTGSVISRILVFIVLLQISQVIYTGCLRGAGDVVYTTIVSIVSVSFVRTIASFLLTYTAGLGIAGIWLGMLIDQIFRFSFSMLRFRSGKWLEFKI